MCFSQRCLLFAVMRRGSDDDVLHSGLLNLECGQFDPYLGLANQWMVGIWDSLFCMQAVILQSLCGCLLFA